MKRLLKSWVLWVFIVPLLAAATIGVGSRSAHGSCLCGAGILKAGWWVGFDGWTWPLGAPVETVSPSRLTSEVLPGTHAHVWDWRGGSRRCLLYGSSRCGGAPVVSGLYVRYESRPAFRGWLRAQVTSGAISRQAVELAVMNPATPHDFAFGWTPP